MPDKNHTFASDRYVNRRRWDYFVMRLRGAEPPNGYELKAVNPPSPRRSRLAGRVGPQVELGVDRTILCVRL
jgi:hypothetical protein